MFILYFVSFVVLPAIFALLVANGTIKICKPKSKPEIATNKPEAVFTYLQSEFSKEVIKLNNRLPEHQRFDFIEVLHALDVKYDIPILNEHYSDRYGCECMVPRARWENPSTYYSFPSPDERRQLLKSMAEYNNNVGKHNRNLPKTCLLYPEFHEFQKAIQDIIDANVDQARALELAGVKSDLDRVSSILDALRNESKIINDATKEIKAL